MDSYDLDEHRRRFAGWAAATAARASPKCRFSREQGLQLLKESGLSKTSPAWEHLPEATDFDVRHQHLRIRLCELAPSILGRENSGFGPGVAAKLINVYLKALFLSGASLQTASPALMGKANAIHPPIDRLLLEGLAKNDISARRDFWRQRIRTGWSSFSHEEYEATINEIRHVTGGALWKIERYWLP